MAAQHDDKKVMKALIFRDYGGVDKLELDSKFPVPEVKDNEVLIKVYYASINPIDYKVLQGLFKNFVPKTLPVVVGYDGSGVIVEVGKNVKNFKPGDEVYADTNNLPRGGTFAEYCATPETHVVKKPAQVSFAEAAAIGVVGFTAYQCLEATKIEKGQKILIFGGTSSVGSNALQIAKALGAHVTTTCSGHNTDLVKKLGAEVVIDYKKQKWWEELKGQNYDAIFDAVGEQEGFANAHLVLKKGAMYVTCAGAPHQSTEDVKFQFISTAVLTPGPHLEKINKLIEQGQFKPQVEKIYDFTLESMVELFKHSMTGRATGKIIAAVAPPSHK